MKLKIDVLKLKFINLNKDAFLFLFSGTTTLIVVLILFFYPLSLFEHLEDNLYDTLVSYLPLQPPSNFVTIVDIDEKSLKEYGQWPWPRYKLAKLLEKLQQMQARSVGLDFVFSEPDNTSIQQLQKNFKQALNYSFSLENIPIHLYDNDQLLSEVLSTGPFVLGYSFLFNTPLLTDQGTASSIINNINFINRFEADILERKHLLYQANGVVNNLPKLTQSVHSSGFFNISQETDGVIRKAPLIIQYKQQLYPSLSLATLMMAMQSEQLILNYSEYGLDSILLDETLIPIDKQGNILIHFHPSDERIIPTVSAIDIINNKVDIADISGHIVLIGTSAKGLQDLHSTPYVSVFPGVKIHAKIIENILQDDFISHSLETKNYELLLLIFIAFTSMLIIAKLSAILSLFINAILILLLVYFSVNYLQNGLYFSVFYSILIVLLNITILYALQYRLKEKNLIKQTIELNKIQESAINMLEHSNVELSENQQDLKQEINNNSQQLIKAFSQLDQFNRDLSDSILYGSNIQKSLLPQEAELQSSFSDYFVIWEPRDKVSGDIYFYAKLSKGYIIAVIDCTGHGIPGALLSMIAISALRKIVIVDQIYTPNIILKQLNHSVKTTLGQEKENALSDDGLEISLCYINIEQQQLYFSGAGLPLLVLNRSTLKDQASKLQLIKADRHKIGYKQSPRSNIDYDFTQQMFKLSELKAFYLFTDGLVDQPGGHKNLPFGKKRLMSYIEEHQHLKFIDQKKQLQELLTNYQAKQKRRDDMTILGISMDPIYK